MFPLSPASVRLPVTLTESECPSSRLPSVSSYPSAVRAVPSYSLFALAERRVIGRRVTVSTPDVRIRS